MRQAGRVANGAGTVPPRKSDPDHHGPHDDPWLSPRGQRPTRFYSSLRR